MTRRAIGVITLALAISPGQLAAQDLHRRIEEVINGPDYMHARWGLLVVEKDTGRTVYERNPDQMFVPASTTKLYSCASALCHLGPNYRFETPVYRRGSIESGTLRGDLILVASGDLTFGGRTLPDGTMAFADNDHTYADPTSTTAAVTPTDPLAGLKELARQIKAEGIVRVEGEILIDASLFDPARGSGSGPDRLTPIIVNDNVLDVLIEPAPTVGLPAKVRLRPETACYVVDAQVPTVAAGVTRVEVSAAGAGRIMVRGQIPVNSKPLTRVHVVDDPSTFARALFIETLRREGVAVSASPLRPPTAVLPERGSYAKSMRVAVFTSLPFAEVVKVTLKTSHNLYGSTMPLLVAAKYGERTLADGLHRQRRFLLDLGVNADAVSFAGGAGGETADSTTPRATVELLRALAKRSEFSAFEAGLPILGVDGTLATVVPRESPARGHVRAKGGTLWWADVQNERGLLRSKALAGTLQTARGKAVVFAIFVNDVPLPPGVTPSREGRVLGKLCEIIYQFAE